MTDGIRTERVALAIDRAEREPEATLVFRQHDRGATIAISLAKGGEAFDATGLTAHLMCDAPGGLVEHALDIDGSTLAYVVGADVTARPGRLRPYVELRRGDEAIASTGCFELLVERAADLTAGQAEASQSRLDEAVGAWEGQMEAQQAEWREQTDAQAEAFAEAEAGREDAEAARAQAEAERAGVEDARREAEEKRASAEETRESNEATRKINEAARKSAETNRANAETKRAEAEESRAAAETARREAEEGRAAAEAARREAEDARGDADAAREVRQAKNDADQAANNEAARNNQPVWLVAGQYDPETLVPAVEDPVEGRMYLVPLGQEAALAAVAAMEGARRAGCAVSLAAVAANGSEASLRAAAGGANAYVEWLWHADAGKWEQLGVSQKQVTYVTTDEIDRVAAGSSPSGESVLGLTGLSYLWAKIRYAFAARSHAHSASDVSSGVLPAERGGTGNASGRAASCAGNSATADRLATPRRVSLAGEVTGSATFDGSADASIPASIADGAVTAAKLAGGMVPAFAVSSEDEAVPRTPCIRCVVDAGGRLVRMLYDGGGAAD